MRDRRHRRHRHQHGVPALEELEPLPAHLEAPLVGRQPGAMTQRRMLHPGIVRAGGDARRHLFDLGGAEAAALRGAEELIVDAARVLEREVGPRVARDGGAGALDGVDGGVQEPRDLARQRAVIVVDPGRQAEVAQSLVARRRQRELPPHRLPIVGAGEDVERDLEILDAARHRSGHRDVGLRQRAGRTGDLPLRRHQAVRRLVADHAAAVRRIADRAADVGAELERREAGRERARRAARRSPGAARRVPGIVRLAEHRVVALHVAGVDRQVGLAEDDGARGAQPRHRHGVLSRHELSELGRPRRRAQSRGLVGVLDRHRQTVKRPAQLAARDLFVGRRGVAARALEVERDHQIERAVVPLDARRQRVERLAARDPALADRGRERGGGEVVDLALRGARAGVAHGAPPFSALAAAMPGPASKLRGPAVGPPQNRELAAAVGRHHRRLERRLRFGVGHALMDQRRLADVGGGIPHGAPDVRLAVEHEPPTVAGAAQPQAVDAGVGSRDVPRPRHRAAGEAQLDFGLELERHRARELEHLAVVERRDRGGVGSIGRQQRIDHRDDPRRKLELRGGVDARAATRVVVVVVLVDGRAGGGSGGRLARRRSPLRRCALLRRGPAARRARTTSERAAARSEAAAARSRSHAHSSGSPKFRTMYS